MQRGAARSGRPARLRLSVTRLLRLPPRNLDQRAAGALAAGHGRFEAEASGGGALQPLAAFMTNPAGAAVVNAIGPIRQLVQDGAGPARRYLVIASGTAAAPGGAVQVQR